MQATTARMIDFKTAFDDAVKALLILEPKISAGDAVDRLLQESDPDQIAVLTGVLLRAYFLKLVRAERQSIAKRQRTNQLLLPGFEGLPRVIRVATDRKVNLAEARTTDLTRYLKQLRRTHRDRQANDVKITQVKALLKLMRKYSRKHKGITYGQVAQREIEKKQKC